MNASPAALLARTDKRLPAIKGICFRVRGFPARLWAVKAKSDKEKSGHALLDKLDKFRVLQNIT
jgi:hypothetical protein